MRRFPIERAHPQRKADLTVFHRNIFAVIIYRQIWHRVSQQPAKMIPRLSAHQKNVTGKLQETELSLISRETDFVLAVMI